MTLWGYTDHKGEDMTCRGKLTIRDGVLSFWNADSFLVLAVKEWRDVYLIEEDAK